MIVEEAEAAEFIEPAKSYIRYVEGLIEKYLTA